MNIEITQASKTYTRAGRRFSVLSDVCLSAAPGDLISITGHSGSGKSTLLSIISGIALPDSGSVRLGGHDILSLSERELDLFRNEHIGYIPQGETLLANLTVLDNICLPWFLAPRKGSPRARAKLLLERLGIEGLSGSCPSALSGGEIRRAAVARALINDPDIIIADEPTSNLDAQNTDAIMNILTDIAEKGKIIITATHELDTLKYGNKHYIMESGRLSERT